MYCVKNNAPMRYHAAEINVRRQSLIAVEGCFGEVHYFLIMDTSSGRYNTHTMIPSKTQLLGFNLIMFFGLHLSFH